MNDLIKQVQEACAAVCESQDKPRFSWRKGSETVTAYKQGIGDCAAAIRALDLSRLTSWQDISTAPKDGTSLLGYTAEGICEMFWLYNEWAQSPCYSTYDGAGCAVLSCQPSHWMPLPPTPKEK